jgi:hypothetical protein
VRVSCTSIARVVDLGVELALLCFAIACLVTPAKVMRYFARSWRRQRPVAPSQAELIAFRLFGLLLVGWLAGAVIWRQ